MRLRATIALALITPLMFGYPAKAHDVLIDIAPSAGAVVTESNFEAKLTFNNPLLVVAGESNAELATKLVGSTNWLEHDVTIVGPVLTAQISINEPGDYDLRWKVVSSDGHPINGESSFTLLIENASNQEDSESPSLIAPAPTVEQGSGEGSLVGFYIGLAMVILGVIFAPIGLIIRRRARQS